MKKIIIRNIIGLLVMAWLYYVMLPPINPSAISFWFFICLLAVVFFIVNIGDSKWTVDKNQVKFEKAPESMDRDELEKLIGQVQKKMKRAATELDFENAAILRDQLIELKKILNDLTSL